METIRDAAARVPVRRLSVEVIEGPDAGATASADSITIGTAEGSTLRLDDPSVSRFHLELRAGPGGIAVIDHGSTNGTFAAGLRIERGVVPPGTVLRIGSSSLRVRDADPGPVEMHEADALGGMVGRSPAMRRLMAQVARAAASDVSVLVIGESGTGKELVARALHDLGPRAGKPFVTVDCGALPAALLASELFGHERGAFTGADRAHVGAFEAARGGTVFLDEIGELQPAVQANLLGVLERRRLRRLGSRAEIAVDVRVVAATHRDLRAEVNRSAFRLDLYYRLAVVTLALPPLRERPDDVPLLVEHFLRDAGYDQPLGTLMSQATLDALSRSHFPGNVRELRNLVEAALAMGEPPVVGGGAGGAEPRGGRGGPMPTQLEVDLELPYKAARAEVTEAFEARYLDALLTRAGGNVSLAARHAQMTRSHLNELLAKRRRS